MPLPPEKMGAALASITAWRLDHDAIVTCPVCAAAGLKIIDQSTRPYAEWYALSCSACGLDATVHIPLAPPG
jgi:transcription elongation factor Elf1